MTKIRKTHLYTFLEGGGAAGKRPHAHPFFSCLFWEEGSCFSPEHILATANPEGQPSSALVTSEGPTSRGLS
jgi:hypothetical protein